MSQTALRFSASKTDPGRIYEILKQLRDILEHNAASNGILDPKITEYVFFPLSHVLRQIESLPLKVVELAILCIQILLRTGWKDKVPSAIGVQLLILLTFLSDSNQSKSKRYATSEELRSVALSCLEQLFISLSKEDEGRKALVDVSNVPTISHVISTILDQAKDGPSVDIQVAALNALNAFVTKFPDINALATFLPGTVSALVKVLSTKAGSRRNYRVLVAALDILSNMLVRTLSDDAVSRHGNTFKGKDKPNAPYSSGWLEAASSQMKLALSNVVKLKDHDRLVVRNALLRLSRVIVEHCKECLSNSRNMMLETVATIKARDESELSAYETTDHLAVDDDLRDAFKDCLFNWLTSLPWTMQLKEDQAVSELISRITYAYKVTISHDDTLQMTDSIVITNITDGLAALTKADDKVQNVSGMTMEEMISTKTSVGSSRSTDLFEPVLLRSSGQNNTLKSMLQFLKLLGTSRPQILVQSVRNIQMHQNHLNLASFWLCLNIAKACIQERGHFDTYLHVQNSEGSDHTRLVLEELYGISVNYLTSLDANNLEDWRIAALALESVALQALELREDFRYELIDCLYLVLHLLGSPVTHVQKHAIVTLNIIADACGYMHTSDLVLSNVDYLVNAIALKLNTFDVSPQAPQTLLMMIKLSGSSLLPYLDDLMENIFAILDCYHQYPKLVELLFSVLSSVTEVGTKTPQLALDNAKLFRRRDQCPGLEGVTLSSIAVELKDIARRRFDSLDIEVSDEHTPFPRRPWKEERPDGESTPISAVVHKGEMEADEEENIEDGKSMTADNTEVGPPAPDIYNLLLRIARLTQHYLPSSLPTLRISLLTLLLRVLPILALHENSFLPLINTLWPVLRTRLDDSEGYVVSGALDVMSMMCKYGGEFMKGRTEDLWEGLRKLYGRTVYDSKKSYHRSPIVGKQDQDRCHSLSTNLLGSEARSSINLDISTEQSSSEKNKALALTNGRGRHMNVYVETSTRQIWESLICLFIVMLEHVLVSNEIFDEMLEMLGPVMETQSSVRAALEIYNADAVWLALLKRERLKYKNALGMHMNGIAPNMSDTNLPVDRSPNLQELLAKRPEDQDDWQFASISE